MLRAFFMPKRNGQKKYLPLVREACPGGTGKPQRVHTKVFSIALRAFFMPKRNGQKKYLPLVREACPGGTGKPQRVHTKAFSLIDIMRNGSLKVKLVFCPSSSFRPHLDSLGYQVPGVP